MNHRREGAGRPILRTAKHPVQVCEASCGYDGMVIWWIR